MGLEMDRMTQKRFNKDNPRFCDEFGCVNDLLTGESYLCGESAFVGERDALDTAIALCELLNGLYNENEQLKEELKELKIDNKAKDDAIDGLQSMMAHYNLEDLE